MGNSLEVVPEIQRCEYWVTVTDPSDNQGRHRSHRERCGKPGSRVAIVGTLCTAHAILCEKHAAKADFETYISTNGYAKDVVSKSADLKFRQERLPGTGVVKE